MPMAESHPKWQIFQEDFVICRPGPPTDGRASRQQNQLGEKMIEGAPGGHDAGSQPAEDATRELGGAGLADVLRANLFDLHHGVHLAMARASTGVFAASQLLDGEFVTHLYAEHFR